MNAPLTTPPTDVRVELREEIARLAWAISVHLNVVQNYAELAHDEGLFYALKDAAQCMRAALSFQRALAGVNARIEQEGGLHEQGR